MKLFTTLAILALALTIITPIAYAEKPENPGKPEDPDNRKHEAWYFEELELKYSTDMLEWEEVPGNQFSVYRLELNGNPVDYYYLDVMSMTTREELPDGMYPIYLEDAPNGFLNWWSSMKGVDESDLGNWEGIMYDIITGETPICYLKIVDETYSLIDGLLYHFTGTDEVFRINGDYYLGKYKLRLELSESQMEYFSMIFKGEKPRNQEHIRVNNGKKVTQLYLYEKDPSTWEIVEDGAWGKLTAIIHQNMFVFNGHALTEGDSYSLIYYPDPWPGDGLIVLGTATVNEDGNIHIMGNFDFNGIPIAGDENDGAKIWLVLSEDIDENSMIGWNPETYLFENNLIL